MDKSEDDQHDRQGDMENQPAMHPTMQTVLENELPPFLAKETEVVADLMKRSLGQKLPEVVETIMNILN